MNIILQPTKSKLVCTDRYCEVTVNYDLANARSRNDAITTVKKFNLILRPDSRNNTILTVMEFSQNFQPDSRKEAIFMKDPRGFDFFYH